MASTNPEKLSCISIILCDDVYRDERTKKLVIVGTFNTINVLQTPAMHPQLCVLFSLTNGNGDYDLTLAIEHERTGREILSMQGPLRLESPLAIADVDVRLNGLELPETGKYWVTLRCDGEVVQQRPFTVAMAESTGGEGHAELE